MNAGIDNLTQKVLVIDDCPHIHGLVRAHLRHEPVEVVTASGGEAGLKIAAALRPDLILLDLDMPDLPGLEVLRRLKAEPETLHTPVIVLTGDDSTLAKVTGFELGAADYVTKPFAPTEFKARVRASLRTKYLLDLLARRALLDGLTGLRNRAYFEDRFPAEVALAERHGQPLSLIMFDVDHFKHINDAHGHPFGDEVLRGVAQALMSRVRTSDVVCRYGGEEFAVIQPSAGLASATVLAEDLRACIAGLRFTNGSLVVQVTASFGVAELKENCPPHALMAAADAALYRAKHSGRNCVEPRPIAA